MTDRTLLVVLVAAVALAVAPLGAAGAFAEGAPAQEETVTPTPTPDGNQTTNETTATDSNASLGASVSAFMQSSAAEAEGEVDRGMFAARFNDSDDETRDKLVRERASVLKQRLEALRAQRAELLEDGNTTVAERAKAARLATRIEELREAITQTDRAAERANVSLNRTNLLALRKAAGNLSGPQIAALATDIVDRPDRGQGPPADVSNRSDGNGTDASPPEDAGTGGNSTDAGASEDSGGSGNETDGSESSDGARGDS